MEPSVMLYLCRNSNIDTSAFGHSYMGTDLFLSSVRNCVLIELYKAVTDDSTLRPFWCSLKCTDVSVKCINWLVGIVYLFNFAACVFMISCFFCLLAWFQRRTSSFSVHPVWFSLCLIFPVIQVSRKWWLHIALHCSIIVTFSTLLQGRWSRGQLPPPTSQWIILGESAVTLLLHFAVAASGKTKTLDYAFSDSCCSN